MSNAVYAALGRQAGLAQEMQVVANNIANSSTTGYKADRAVFAELVVPTGDEQKSVSMGSLTGHAFELSQGALKYTQGRFDLAIQGDGFFQVETPQGNRLTRAGNFSLSEEGTLIDTNGNPVLGVGGNPLTIPETANNVVISQDGTIAIDGETFDRVGTFVTEGLLTRDTSTYFDTDGAIEELETPVLIQGALEASNVSPVIEIARLIEVQRAYEAGQALLEREDQRLSQLVAAIKDR